MSLIIATRKSKLAQAQTELVMELLNKTHGINSEKLLIVTEGDRRLDVTLDKIGGKGVFVKDIELALLEERAHGAVHSMKDVPYALDDAFMIAAVPEREDVRDVFISREGIDFKELKTGAKIGTSSIRRAGQLKNLRNDLDIVPIRGNVQTRLEKMKTQNLDGIILAAAGLKRLGLEDIITTYFDPKEMLPAVGQGALGIEVLKNSDKRVLFEALDNKEVRCVLEAERSFMRTLNGDCHTLIGVYSEVKGADLYMIGTYDIDGQIIKKDILGNKEDNIDLGKRLANLILKA
ncbi:hydroxymethylbilane synthase [Clostridium intestinale]|uniref:hydroxymethylbilane synthase n=1 Tax=Clostridium intestinale TaxID=36845 RepID=UPI002DD63E8B|nr:hydroxymethylbilane synthase [Clostridium intestinale]WRY50468.1 hydroxymethylbilane synthase [Clostridium intestinale]